MSGHRELAAGSQHPAGFGEDGVLVGAEVDHAVGNHHVDGGVAEREVFDAAFDEGGVVDAGFGFVAFGELEHLVGHAQARCASRRATVACGQQHVESTAGAQVEHVLAEQVDQGGGVAAAQ